MENEKLEQVIAMAAGTQAQGKLQSTDRQRRMTCYGEKGKKPGSSGGNICLAYNGNEDVDPG